MAHIRFLWNLLWKDVPILGRIGWLVWLLAGTAAPFIMIRFGYGLSVLLFEIISVLFVVAAFIAFRTTASAVDLSRRAESKALRAEIAEILHNGYMKLGRLINAAPTADDGGEWDASVTKLCDDLQTLLETKLSRAKVLSLIAPEAAALAALAPQTRGTPPHKSNLLLYMLVLDQLRAGAIAFSDN